MYAGKFQITRRPVSKTYMWISKSLQAKAVSKRNKKALQYDWQILFHGRENVCVSHTPTQNDSLLSPSLCASDPTHSVLAHCRGLSQQRASTAENKQPSKLFQMLTFPGTESQNQDSKNSTQGTAPTIVLHTRLLSLSPDIPSHSPIMGNTKLVEATPVKFISVSYTHIHTYRHTHQLKWNS